MIGLVEDMKDGIVFVAPFDWYTEYSGLAAGLEPPWAGWEWQLTQLFELNTGPSPPPRVPGVLGTTTTRLKAVVKSGNIMVSVEGKFPIKFPAPVGGGRSPGSFAVCACSTIPTAEINRDAFVIRANL